MANVKVFSNRYETESLYQWSLNQILTIYGLSLPAVPEIHFTNDALNRAIVRPATMNNAGVVTVKIPNSLLQSPYNITAYVCIDNGDVFESLYQFTIPVKARKKPADYKLEITDEEVYSFRELTDIRVGYDGTKYSSAGEAVRTQVKSVSDKVNAVKNEMKNDLTAVETKIKADIVAVETKIENNINNVKNDIDADVTALDTRITKLESEWDFVIDSCDRLGEIKDMHGNVLISCEASDEYSIGIDVPNTVTYLKMDISIYSDYAVSYVKGHSKCTLDGCAFGRSGTISGFREVRNVGVTDGTISNCGFVYNCTALDFTNCNYVELAAFEDTGGNEGQSASISKCRHICHINYYRSSANLNISNCDVVENIDGDGWGAELTITNAKTVDAVSGFSSVTYENCKYVNPSTCQDYVSQQNAVGKVQLLTADGSFAVADISGSGSGGSSSKWDISKFAYVDHGQADNTLPLNLIIDFDIPSYECAMFEMIIHSETDGVHKCGYYILEFYQQNGAECVPMITSSTLPITTQNVSENSFKITCEVSGLGIATNTSVDIRFLSGDLSNVNVYLAQ